ncbi:MAG: acyl-CoA dehydrogenase family protein [Dehalococcoidia bacterium]|nr:acyl-CoA dehydrogenase family protein [Dehalococcoidia bacterium]
MQFTVEPEVEAFRDEVRAFLHAEWDPSHGHDPGHDPDQVKAFERRLAQRGWLTLAWPTEFGGAGAGHLRQVVFNEEMAYAAAPTGNHGLSWVGPTLMLHGTEEQKARYLPPIARADEYWCTLYSEPNAGSDLASLQLRARLDGDDFVIDGQKIWSGRAHYADFGWLAARTDPNAPKHQGITLMMVDMKSPGITIRPLIDMAGRHHFNEIFFEGVRVPRRNAVGEVNRGWYHIAVALDFERSGIMLFANARRIVERTAHRLGRSCGGGEQRQRLRHELADRAIEIAVGRNLAYRVAFLQAAKQPSNKESSATRVFGTELMQRTTHTALRAAGMEAQLFPGASCRVEDLAGPYLVGMSDTIAGGTSEIQRGIIATRGLGLPRG